MERTTIRILVGIFVITAVLSLAILAFQVSGLNILFKTKKDYVVKAVFDNIGGLQVRAPVTLSGVKIGEVTAIDLNQTTFQAVVSMRLRSNFNCIPDDTSSSIYTAGLIGSNYISLSPGYAKTFLHNNSMISDTHPALVLENLLSQYLFKLKQEN